ncbi:MAG TPA: D,D-dipeptide ABC transporter permease, partial [Chloroflexota bacterium]|nr:D,D-dipeptide ABC transporter permease [Chloroflexota bacterium]
MSTSAEASALARPTAAVPAARPSRVGGLVQRHPRLLIGGTLVLLLLLMAAFAPLLAPYDPIAGDVSQGLQPPN